MNPERLFVYGSLRAPIGDPAIDRLLQRALRGAVAATITGRLYDLGAYPGAVAGTDPAERVHGLLIAIPSQRWLQRLDRYEDFRAETPERSEFVRTVVTTRPCDGRAPVDAWAYLYNGPIAECPRIRSGRYEPHGVRTRANAASNFNNP